MDKTGCWPAFFQEALKLSDFRFSSPLSLPALDMGAGTKILLGTDSGSGSGSGSSPFLFCIYGGSGALLWRRLCLFGVSLPHLPSLYLHSAEAPGRADWQLFLALAQPPCSEGGPVGSGRQCLCKATLQGELTSLGLFSVLLPYFGC